MRNIVIWFLVLPMFLGPLQDWIEQAYALPGSRRPAIASIKEFFGAPVVHIVKKQLEALEAIRETLPPHSFEDSSKKSVTLEFASLSDRESACDILSAQSIQYRTGKTLVPFRLSGNIDWGVPVPEQDGLDGLTFWVWPESLWAPISFTATYLESLGKDPESWKDWWCSPDSQVFQFIGEDNVLWAAEWHCSWGCKGLNFPANPLRAAAVSRFDCESPSAFLTQRPAVLARSSHHSRWVLKYYSQLSSDLFHQFETRTHSISFQPHFYNPKAKKTPQIRLKRSKLLTNIFNRVIWKVVETLHNDHEPLPSERQARDHFHYRRSHHRLWNAMHTKKH